MQSIFNIPFSHLGLFWGSSCSSLPHVLMMLFYLLMFYQYLIYLGYQPCISWMLVNILSQSVSGYSIWFYLLDQWHWIIIDNFGFVGMKYSTNVFLNIIVEFGVIYLNFTFFNGLIKWCEFIFLKRLFLLHFLLFCSFIEDYQFR